MQWKNNISRYFADELNSPLCYSCSIVISKDTGTISDSKYQSMIAHKIHKSKLSVHLFKEVHLMRRYGIILQLGQ